MSFRYSRLASINKISRATARDFIQLIEQLSSYSDFGFSNIIWRRPNKRRVSDFAGADFLCLDVDVGPSAAATSARLGELKLPHAIFASKSHQLSKSGMAPRDRYRVIVPLSEPIVELADFIATMKMIKERLPYIDPQCLDGARFYHNGQPGPPLFINLDHEHLAPKKASPKDREEAERAAHISLFGVPKDRLTEENNAPVIRSVSVPGFGFFDCLNTAEKDLNLRFIKRKKGLPFLHSRAPHFFWFPSSIPLVSYRWQKNNTKRRAVRIKDRVWGMEVRESGFMTFYVTHFEQKQWDKIGLPAFCSREQTKSRSKKMLVFVPYKLVGEEGGGRSSRTTQTPPPPSDATSLTAAAAEISSKVGGGCTALPFDCRLEIIPREIDALRSWMRGVRDCGIASVPRKRCSLPRRSQDSNKETGLNRELGGDIRDAGHPENSDFLEPKSRGAILARLDLVRRVDLATLCTKAITLSNSRSVSTATEFVQVMIAHPRVWGALLGADLGVLGGAEGVESQRFVSVRLSQHLMAQIATESLDLDPVKQVDAKKIEATRRRFSRQIELFCKTGVLRRVGGYQINKQSTEYLLDLSFFPIKEALSREIRRAPPQKKALLEHYTMSKPVPPEPSEGGWNQLAFWLTNYFSSKTEYMNFLTENYRGFIEQKRERWRQALRAWESHEKRGGTKRSAGQK